MRELKLIDQLGVFIPGAIEGPIKIPAAVPLRGVLLCDVTVTFFLAPEDDYRGGGMGSIRVVNVPAEAKHNWLDKLVDVTGVYEDGVMTIETMVRVKV